MEDFGGLKVPSGILSGTRRRKGNCGIVALASILDKSIEEATEIYAKVNQKSGHWQGKGTNFSGRKKVLDKYNIKYQESFDGLGLTFERFAYSVRHISDVTFVINTTGHVQVLRNGYVLDQAGPKKVREYWGRRKKINRAVIQIIP